MKTTMGRTARLLTLGLLLGTVGCGDDDTGGDEDMGMTLDGSVDGGPDPDGCPAGTVETVPGTATEPPQCTPCLVGTYCAGGDASAVGCGEADWDDDADPATACAPFTDCVAGERVAAEGDATTDRTCAACADGTFTDTTNATECAPYSDCEPGELFTTEPSASMDRDCTACPAGETSLEVNATECFSDLAMTEVSGFLELTCGLLRTNGALLCWGRDSIGILGERPERAAAVEVGNLSMCTLNPTTRHVSCFGNDRGGSVDDAPTDTPLLDLEGFTNHYCGIREADGHVVCWGDDTNGVITDAPSGVPVDAIASGFDFSCAIRRSDSEVVCWGFDDQGQVTDTPTGFAADAIAASTAHACALAQDTGLPTCWGWDDGNQVTDTPTSTAFDAIATGREWSCGIRRADGAIECWGDDSDGIVSDAPSGAFASITAGADHACALGAEGVVTCWGRDDRAQVSGAPTHEPAYRDLGAGGASLCAVREADGSLVCFGSATLNDDAPSGAFDAVAVAPNGAQACAIDAGAITCWGDDTDGIVSDSPSTGTFADVGVGNDHACALATDSSLTCWGDDTNGRATAPTGSGFTGLSVGTSASCALSSDDLARCWGAGNVSATAPDATALDAVATGTTWACGILQLDGTVTCWGESAPGAPTELALDGIGAGVVGCGIRRTDGEIACWGGPAFGAPDVPSRGSFTSIEGSGAAFCGQRADGTRGCWGRFHFNPR